MKRKSRSTARRVLAFLLVVAMMFDMIPFTALTLEVKAAEDHVITEIPDVDGGESSNWNDSENYDKLVDGALNTKYGLSGNDPWVEFHYSHSIVPKGYILWTANDSNGERNPREWTIKAKNQPGDEWTVLDYVNNSDTNQLVKTNNSSQTYSIDNTSAYRYFRFEATRETTYGNFQLAELQFVVDPTDIRNAVISGLGRVYGYDNGAAIPVSYNVAAADGTALTENDYTAEIRDENEQPVNTIAQKGTYSLVVSGKGSYTGSVSFFFEVKDFLSGGGTKGLPYIIDSNEDWELFANEENHEVCWGEDVYVKLAADVSTSLMVGSETHKYKGCFDGAGHSLNITLSASNPACAPFRYVKNAEIKHLTVNGTINNSKKQNGGLVAYSYGTTDISFCVVNVTITCGFYGDSSNGGFVADNKEGDLTIRNCAFYGSLKGSQSHSNGGFVGWRSTGSISIVNCLFAPSEITMGNTGSDTFVRDSEAQITNSYYTRVYQVAQGTVADSNKETLRAALGDNWIIRDDRVIPNMHGHEFSYEADGSTITATCNNTAGICDLNEGNASLTIVVPEHDTYGDGKACAATITGDTVVLGTPKITYKQGETVLDAAPAGAGSYTASFTLGGVTAETDYTVLPKTVTITGLSALDKTYDGTTTATVSGTAEIDGKLESDDLAVTAGTASFASAEPGTGIGVSFAGYSLSGEDAANYTLSSQPASVTADINRRSLIVKANDQSIYDNEDIVTGTDMVSVTGGAGLLEGDELAEITLTRVDDHSLGTHQDAIEAGGAVIKRDTTDVSTCYQISYESGDLVIRHYGGAQITTAPVAASGLIYNGSEQALLTAGGEANSGAVQYKLDDGNWNDIIPSAKNAGTYTVSYRAKGNEYYSTGPVSSYSVTIAKAPLTVTANDNTIIYGDEPSDAGVSYTGFVGGETEAVLGGSLTYEYNYKQYDPRYKKHDAEKPVYLIIPAGLTSDNYEISYVSGLLKVDKKPVGVVWSNTILTYNGHNQGPVPTLTGVVNNDEVVVTVSGVKKYPGTYTAGAVLFYLSRENYIITEGSNCSFTIIKAPSPVEIDGEASVAKSGKSVDLSDKVTMNKASGEVSYAINGDAKGCRLEGSTFISGSSTGIVSVNVAVAEDSCYEAMEAGTIYVKVCDKAQDIAFEEAEVNKSYGDADFTNVLKGAKTAVRYEVTEGSEVASVSENGMITIKAAGTAVITATAEEDSVYAGAAASYTLTVARKAITVKAEDKGKKEGEQDPVFTAVIEGLVNGDDESLISYSISREQGEFEGSYAIIPSGVEEQGNYSVSYRNAVLTIESVIVEGRKYTIHMMTGAIAKNKAGEPVYTANENERISISWTPREGYEFVRWDISGAAAEEAVSANTAFRMGAGDVTVSYEEKLTAAAEVTEEKTVTDNSVKIKKVKFADKKLTLIKHGGIKENKAVAEGDENAKIVYVTGNKDIVAVDQSGRFYPVGVGETSVTAYCGNKSASCKVTVVSYTNELIIKDECNEYIKDQLVEMKSGEQKFFTVSFEPYDSTDPRTVSWRSDNKKVKVKNGLVTAAEVNEVTEVKLTATVKTADPDKNDKLISRTVNIRLVPTAVPKASSADKSHTLKLKKNLKLNATENKTAELQLTLSAKGDTDITAVKVVAESSNPLVVSVNALTEGGTEESKRSAAISLEAGKAGTAYIIVKTYSPGSSEPNVKLCKVSVTKPAAVIAVKSGTLKVSDKNIEMRKGQNGTVEVSLDPAFSTDAGKLKLSGSGGVKVKNGIIYAVKAKKGKITVKCGKLKEVITVTVTE